MTAIAQIKRGDKVRVTHTSGETHEVTVHAIASNGDSWVFSTSGLYFYRSSGWVTFEVVKPAPTPLPTAPGLYAPGESDHTRFLLLTRYGKWYWVDFTGTTPESVCEPEASAKAYADTIRPVYLYKGRTL